MDITDIIMSLLDQVEQIDNSISISKLTELGLQPRMYCAKPCYRYNNRCSYIIVEVRYEYYKPIFGPLVYCSRDLNRYGIYHIRTIQDPTMDEVTMVLSLVKNDR